MFRLGLKWVLPGQGCETTGLRTLDLFSSSYSRPQENLGFWLEARGRLDNLSTHVTQPHQCSCEMRMKQTSHILIKEEPWRCWNKPST